MCIQRHHLAEDQRLANEKLVAVWLNAIAVAKLEPVRCPAPCEIHPVCYSSHKQRNMIQ